MGDVYLWVNYIWGGWRGGDDDDDDDDVCVCSFYNVYVIFFLSVRTAYSGKCTHRTRSKLQCRKRKNKQANKQTPPPPTTTKQTNNNNKTSTTITTTIT